ncbi:hypothetical protein PIB30_020709 [Stylosanthes scabra]|uniref:Aminotransferase-like plant mobile domain-containing protein n=1 Tax=Stylosanthes scabra TaxID=79078 RepID=A0ABU6XA18_9FABA|nr:hypothetical protein [Stylosanthes scabra]
MFGEPPTPPVADQCTVTFSWLMSTFGVLPDHPTDEMVLMHAKAYIWMLLSICLFGDKTGARAHVRWLPYLLRMDDLVRYSWGSPSWIFLQFPLLRPPTFNDIEWPLASRYLPTSDKKDPQLQRLRRQLDLMPFSEFICLPYRTLEVDRVIPQFGGVQNCPHPALNIDFLHAKDGRRSDQWFPQTFQRWHALWATRFQQLFQVVPSADPGPTADFIRWWILAGRRYLVPADRFHHLPPHEIPVEATQRQSGPHPARPDLPHVPDNRRPARRMMVGTRTTAWDWQWLDDMMGEDAPAAPPTGGRTGRGHGEGGDVASTQQTQGGASTSQAVEEAGTSSQAYLSPTPQTQGTTIPSTMGSPSQQAFLDGLHSPGFEQLISDIMREGGSGYRPDTQFDGSPVHLDLNEPMSGPSHLFMALGGTPPSTTHVPGASWDVPFMEPARLQTPPVSPAPAEQPSEPAAPERARRAPRRPGCGTGGHV